MVNVCKSVTFVIKGLTILKKFKNISIKTIRMFSCNWEKINYNEDEERDIDEFMKEFNKDGKRINP